MNEKADLKLLESTKKAFQLCKCKLITLHYVVEQIEPILKRYMENKDVLKVTFDLRKKDVLALEPIENCERDLWVQLWLDDELSTEELVERMKYTYQTVQYTNVSDFLGDIEAWIKREQSRN